MYKEEIYDVITGETTFRNYDESEIAKMVEEEQRVIAEKKQRQLLIESRKALLAKLGITEEEAKLLLS